jgi:hypothetical protein
MTGRYVAETENRLWQMLCLVSLFTNRPCVHENCPTGRTFQQALAQFQEFQDRVTTTDWWLRAKHAGAPHYSMVLPGQI